MIRDDIAQAVARNLRKFGYQDVTAEQVIGQLTKPDDERDIIGKMAAGILETNGLAPNGSPLPCAECGGTPRIRDLDLCAKCAADYEATA